MNLSLVVGYVFIIILNIIYREILFKFIINRNPDKIDNQNYLEKYTRYFLHLI